MNVHRLVHLLNKAKFYLNRLGIPTSLNDWKLQQLKNRYSGKRCFIIGSGPSMKIEYLDRLQNEFTFSANQIFKIFNQTNWCPTLYVKADIKISR